MRTACSAEKTLQGILATLRGASEPSEHAQSQEALLQEIYAEIVDVPAQGYPSSVEARLGQVLSYLTGVRVSGRLSKEFLVRQIAGVLGGQSYETGLREMVFERPYSAYYQVDQSSDDGDEKETTKAMLLNATDIRMQAVSGLRYWGGFRFRTGRFPAVGSIITAAYLEGYSFDVSYDDPYLDIYADDSAAPGTFTLVAGNISNRTPTAASVPWVATGLGFNMWLRSPSLTSIIQELVNSYSIAAVALIFKPKLPAGPYNFRFRSWDEASHVLGAKLHLEWTE